MINISYRARTKKRRNCFKRKRTIKYPAEELEKVLQNRKEIANLPNRRDRDEGYRL